MNGSPDLSQFCNRGDLFYGFVRRLDENGLQGGVLLLAQSQNLRQRIMNGGEMTDQVNAPVFSGCNFLHQFFIRQVVDELCAPVNLCLPAIHYDFD